MHEMNPLLPQALTECQYPPFYRIQPEHVVPGMAAILEACEGLVEAAEQAEQCSWDAVMLPLEETEALLTASWGAVSHLHAVKNSDELRAVYSEAQGTVVTFQLRLSQSEALYRQYTTLQKHELSPSRKRIIDAAVKEAELSGIALQADKKERFNAIQMELSELSTTFSNHVLDATKAFAFDVTNSADVTGWPASLKALAAQTAAAEGGEPDADNGPWRITLDIPLFMPFMQHCQNRTLREQVYRAFITRASKGESNNLPIIEKILSLRTEKAALLGYANHAEISLATKMADDIQAVATLHDELRGAARPAAQKEWADMSACAGIDLAQWDAAFWAERLREQRYDYTDEDIRPYFSLPRVLDGLWALAYRLFAIRVEAADGEAPVWHEDVRFFSLFDEEDTLRAQFYLDPYSRPAEKRGGAWMNVVTSRRIKNGQIVIPIAHMVCNQTPPVAADGTPSLMTFREVETLFHEFGHALQHMLTTVDESGAAGISNVEWDAVELPSQFMENWCYHKPTLLNMAKHYQTGEQLPEDLFEKICASRLHNIGLAMMRQIQFGSVDLALHSQLKGISQESILKLQQHYAEEHAIIEPLAEDRFLCSFSHIFAGGYSAGYYSYKWAEVLSADAFSAFEEVGLDNREAVSALGRRYRDTILASGGSAPPSEIFAAFRGRGPSTEALLRHSGFAV